MPGLLFVVYLIVEIAALVAVAHWVGVLWTVLIVLAASVLGAQLIRSQGRRVFDGLAAAARGDREPGGALADSALVALGALLMVIPGLVTSALGALLLLPPTRRLMRPLAVLLASRRFGLVGAAGTVFDRGRGHVVEGEVVDVHDEMPPNHVLRPGPDGA